MRRLRSSPLSELEPKKLPSTWEQVELGEIIDGAQYGLNSPADPNGNTAIIGMKDLSRGRVSVRNLAKTIATAAERSTHRVQVGDLLLNRTNSYELVGKAGIVDTATDAVFASYLVRLKCKTDHVDPWYLNYFLSGPSAQVTMKRVATPAVAQANINPTELQKFCVVPLPPMPEQRRVAEILRTWDEAIEKTERLIEAKEKLFKRHREQLAWNVEAVGHNSWAKLGNVIEQRRERVGPGRNLRVFSVTTYGLVPQDEHFNKRISTEDVSRHMLVRPGDLALSGLNFWLGSVDVSLDAEQFCISPDYKVFQLRDVIEPTFLRHMVRTAAFRKILIGAAVERASVVRRNLDRETLLDSEVPLPSRDVQLKLVAALDAEERELVLIRAQRDAIDKQKRGLMQKLLTGEWRVAVNEPPKKHTNRRAAG